MTNQSVVYQVRDLINQCSHTVDIEHNSKSSWTSHKQQKFLEQFVAEKFAYHPGVKSICIHEFNVDANLSGMIVAFMYPQTVTEAEIHRRQWGENPPLYGFLMLEMQNGKPGIQVTYPNQEQIEFTADISVTGPVVADQQSYSEPTKEKPKTFVDFVSNLAAQVGWQVSRTEYDDYAVMSFTFNNRKENVDISYQSLNNNGTNIICFCSSEIPAGDDSFVELTLDDYFLERNMATFPGHWAVMKIDDKKHYVFVIKMEISKLKVEDFRSAISTIINERQLFFDMMSAG
jgi:hypothetical protein